MPRGDQTGPMGQGPMTGRAAGYCAGHEQPGCDTPAPGRGYGRGMGSRRGAGGRGWRRMFRATGLPGWMRFGAPAEVTDRPELEARSLRQQVSALQSALESVTNRLHELEAESAKR